MRVALWRARADGARAAQGRYTPALAPAELIAKVVIPLATLEGCGTFVAFKRAAAAYPTASCALQVQLRGDVIESARLALGCVGLTPLVVDVMTRLRDRTWAGVADEEIAALAAEQAQPLSDNKGSADYKRSLIQGLVRRALRIVRARARGMTEPEATHTYYG